MCPAAEQSPSFSPGQEQHRQPGRQAEMQPAPLSINPQYRGADKLLDKIAVISGGDSGIGRAVALHFAREGADIGILYLDEHEDARETQRLVVAEGRRCTMIAGDARDAQHCREAVAQLVAAYGRIDVLVNHLGAQWPQPTLETLDSEQLQRAFATNVFPFFYITQAALPHMPRGAAIINTGSVTSFRGSPQLVDYAATKGAIQAYTYSLAIQLAKRGIRVNGVAPGPIWTPLIVASFRGDKLAHFGQDTLLGRAGQPAEVAPAYVYLASRDAAYVTGQFLHVNGGSHIGG